VALAIVDASAKFKERGFVPRTITWPRSRPFLGKFLSLDGTCRNRSSQQLQRLNIPHVNIVSTRVDVADTAGDLGLIMDSQLSLSAQVAALSRSGYFQLRQLRPIIRSLTIEAAKTIAQAFSLGAVSYSPSIVTMALPCVISDTKRDIGRKSWFFSYPLHSTPPLRRSPSEYCHAVWYKKTRMVGLTNSEKKFEDMCNRFDRIPPCDRQTDRQTDGRTSYDGIVRAMQSRSIIN